MIPLPLAERPDDFLVTDVLLLMAALAELAGWQAGLLASRLTRWLNDRSAPRRAD